MEKRRVWVVHYDTFFDGEYSSSGVYGVFSDQARAEKAADKVRADSCKEAWVDEFDVDLE